MSRAPVAHVSSFREQLAQAQGGSPLIGTWVKLPCTESVELLALAAVDFIAIDLEHATIDESMASHQIAIARALGVAPIVRVARTATHEVTRLLDAGADGIIFPRIGDAADATFAGDQVRFEPAGTRGMGISSRAGDWGLRGADAYLDERRRPACIVMIESVAGVDSIEQILSGGGVDAVLIGPADLTLALGCGSDTQHAHVQHAIDRVVAATQSAAVPCGIALGSAADIAWRTAQGFCFFVVSNDATMLGRSCAELVGAARLHQ